MFLVQVSIPFVGDLLHHLHLIRAKRFGVYGLDYEDTSLSGI